MNTHELFDKAETYIIYYGKGKDEILAEYDLAIVEPSGQQKDYTQKIKKHGAVVLAYISVIELPDYSELCRFVKEEDYLVINGAVARNEIYQNNMMDLESPRWVSVLKFHVGDLIYNQGYDGVFLDTIGDSESVEVPLDVQNRMINSAVSFVKELRNTFPDILIVQNSGLQKLIWETAPFLDGVCWENPPFEVQASNSWTMVRRDYLLKLFDEGKKVLFLTDGSVPKKRVEMTRNNAETYHFPFYHAEKGFTQIVDE